MQISLTIREVVIVRDKAFDTVYLKLKDNTSFTKVMGSGAGPAYVESLGVGEYTIIDTVNKTEY
jgi:hypothetical protein